MLDRLATGPGLAGDFAKARALADESLALFRELDDRHGALYPLSKVAWDEWKRGDPKVGIALTEEALTLARESGDTWWQAELLPQLAEMLHESGEHEKEAAAGRECVSLAHQLGDTRTLLHGLATLAAATAAAEDTPRAGRLWGAAETLEARGETNIDEDAHARYRAAVRTLPAAELEAAIAEGRAMTIDQAVAFALATG